MRPSGGVAGLLEGGFVSGYTLRRVHQGVPGSGWPLANEEEKSVH